MTALAVPSPVLHANQLAEPPATTGSRHWPFPARLGFRWLVVHTVLYVFPFPLGLFPGIERVLPGLDATTMVFVRRHLTRMPLLTRGFRWVQEFPYNR